MYRFELGGGKYMVMKDSQEDGSHTYSARKAPVSVCMSPPAHETGSGPNGIVSS